VHEQTESNGKVNAIIENFVTHLNEAADQTEVELAEKFPEKLIRYSTELSKTDPEEQLVQGISLPEDESSVEEATETDALHEEEVSKADKLSVEEVSKTDEPSKATETTEADADANTDEDLQSPKRKRRSSRTKGKKSLNVENVTPNFDGSAKAVKRKESPNLMKRTRAKRRASDRIAKKETKSYTPGRSSFIPRPGEK